MICIVTCSLLESFTSRCANFCARRSDLLFPLRRGRLVERLIVSAPARPVEHVVEHRGQQIDRDDLESVSISPSVSA
jgi:hypothetical protein